MPFPADRAVLELLGTLEPDYLIDLIDVMLRAMASLSLVPYRSCNNPRWQESHILCGKSGRACEYKPVLIKGHKPWIPVNRIKMRLPPNKLSGLSE